MNSRDSPPLSPQHWVCRYTPLCLAFRACSGDLNHLSQGQFLNMAVCKYLGDPRRGQSALVAPARREAGPSACLWGSHLPSVSRLLGENYTCDLFSNPFRSWRRDTQHTAYSVIVCQHPLDAGSSITGCQGVIGLHWILNLHFHLPKAIALGEPFTTDPGALGAGGGSGGGGSACRKTKASHKAAECMFYIYSQWVYKYILHSYNLQYILHKEGLENRHPLQ